MLGSMYRIIFSAARIMKLWENSKVDQGVTGLQAYVSICTKNEKEV